MGVVRIDPVECALAATDSFLDLDLDDYIESLPSGVSGVILHVELENTGGVSCGFAVRKNGSTDDRSLATLNSSTHTWAMIGVDAGHIFEYFTESTIYLHVYIIGYTTDGFIFNTNAVDKSTATTEAWEDVDCSASAPGAVGLIFEVAATSSDFGLRKNGSTDDRTANNVTYHNSYTRLIGCDANQICEQYIGATSADLFLIGYITSGATFNTNATDMSLDSTDAYADLAALPAGAIGGIFTVYSSGTYSFALRENGSTEDIYYAVRMQSGAFVPCDDNRIIEGKISDVGVDFWLEGYFTSGSSYCGQGVGRGIGRGVFR